MTSSAIGQFQIGISPIGAGAFVPYFDVEDTVISQYANSPTLLEMIDNFSQCVDQEVNWESFYNLIWNVDTAVGYGLDVWGRIVGVNRALQVTTGAYFGFNENGGTDVEPFNQAPFWTGTPFTENYLLSDYAYRQLILAKAFANICDGSILAINNILMTLFGSSGKCYVTDGRDMTMTYTFKFDPTPVQLAIIEQSHVLPKPVGVVASVVISP